MTRSDAHRFTAPLVAILLMFVAVAASAAGPTAGKAIAFLTGPNEGDAFDIANAYIQSHRQQLGLQEADLEDVVVRDRYVTKHNGITHLVLQQRLDGIEVYNGQIDINIARDGSVINLHNGFVSDLANKVNTASPGLTDTAAIDRVATHFGLAAPELSLVSGDGGADRRAVFSDAALSRVDIPVRLIYQPVDGGAVRLAWDASLALVRGTDWWSVRVDAETGDVISQHNWTNDDSYRAIQFPAFSDPEDSGGQTVIVDPADPIASPFGWHDTDGVPGAESTLTRGNNVNAQDDLDGNNFGGLSPDGGAGLDFLFNWDPADQPTEGTNLEAAIVNLFYANNVMHDLSYHYGFDEPAGNFQTNNYGNGGIGGDEVRADALDGAQATPPSCNNATFGTPPDGGSGVMSMFLWPALLNGTLTTSAGSFACGKGCWGGELEPPTTAAIEEVDDGTAAPTEGCNALIGFTPGNIALIDRGGCEFGVKAQNAETAGAVAAVIVNDLQQGANGILAMGAGAVGGLVTIPAVMVGNADGTTIRNALPDSGTIEQSTTQVDRDSDFDNGIIAHEYGHGISNRLVGGPGNVGCLSGSEQYGEGGSDFWTLVLTAKSSDRPDTAKGVGNYVIFEPVNGPGIRNFPYSTDLGVNPQTYADIDSTNVPHGVGEIWMAMVWELYWELVAKHGFDGDFYFGTGGNNLTIQLFMDSMKLGGCNPTFLTTRDAFLAADLANTGGDNECEIWRAFAKRGAGVSAVAGSINVGDETEAFDIPGGCPAVAPSIFTDGFESGDTLRWDSSVP